MSDVRRTVNALSVLLLLAIEDGVLVLWNHLLLHRHLALPSLNSFRGLSLLCQCLIYHRDNSVDRAESFTLSRLLEFG